MVESFSRDDAQELLTKCHRRCCVCHRFCGAKIELDHIVPRGKGGPNTIDNAIALCFECHAEVHSYNDQHPRGRKFRPDELRNHKNQWLDICRTSPEVFFAANRTADVGPVQALIDELEFNVTVAAYPSPDDQGCLFLDEQFRRAIHEGAIAILEENLKGSIIEAYVAIGRANQLISAAMRHGRDTSLWGEPAKTAQDSISQARDKIASAKRMLLEFLGGEVPD